MTASSSGYKNEGGLSAPQAGADKDSRSEDLIGRQRKAAISKRVERCILLGCMGIVIVGYALIKPFSDFVEYWASAHQLVAGRNPYSFPEIFQLEKALGWSRPMPYVAMNPPWALPLISPIGLARSYVAAWIVWVTVLTFILWWSTRLLLDLYAGPARIFPSESYASEAILGLTFFPGLACLALAQITPLILLGLAGFLWCESRKRYVLAGMCLLLVAIKPQLLYLFWLALVLTFRKKRNWRVLLSFVGTIGVFTMIANLLRPGILAEYWQFLHSGYLRVWPSAMGALLRYPFKSRDMFLLQFLPPFAGTVWFVVYWLKRRHAWDWKEQMPVLVTASVLTTAYGWTFDQMVFMVPIVAIAAGYVAREGKLPQKMVILYTALNVALIAGMLSWRIAFLPAPLTVGFVLYLQGRAGHEVQLASPFGEPTA